jgi:hypothetical protein
MHLYCAFFVVVISLPIFPVEHILFKLFSLKKKAHAKKTSVQKSDNERERNKRKGEREEQKKKKRKLSG